MKCSGRSVAEASRVIEIDDVFVPTMASALSTGQRLAKIARLVSSFSVATSMMRSQSAKASSVSAGEMRLSAACGSSSVMRLRVTWRAMLPLIVAMPALIRSAERSLSLTSNPASALTWAMPLPICPAPITPILRMGNAMLSERARGRSLTSIMFVRLFYADPARDTTLPWSHVSCCSTVKFVEVSRQLRQRLRESRDRPVIGELQDRRLFILVDRHNYFRILHAAEMLNRSGNPDRDVKLRCHDLAGLADLPVIGRISRVHCRARRADCRPQLIGDRQDIFSEIFGALHRPP